MLKKDTVAPVPNNIAPAGKAVEGAEKPPGIALILGAIVAVTGFLIAFAYCCPVINIVTSMPQGLISLLILFWGLQQAWRLTRKVSLEFRGPFQVGGQGPSQPEVSAHA